MHGSTDHAIGLMRALPLADFIRLDTALEEFELDSAGDGVFRVLRKAGRETLRGLTVQESDALKDMVRRRRAS